MRERLVEVRAEQFSTVGTAVCRGGDGQESRLSGEQ